MPASAQVTKLNVQPIRNLRWWIGALLFASTVINYIDRQTLSLLSPYLKQLYHWTNSDYANLLIGFRIAYSIGQSVCGRLMDRVGTRRGLTLSVLWYSIVSMATALATGFYSFATFRFLLGAGESANWPGATKAVSEWFPKRERALATALFDSGSSIGGAVAPFVVFTIYSHWGWRPAFAIPGMLGFVWLLVWRRAYHPPKPLQFQIQHRDSGGRVALTRQKRERSIIMLTVRKAEPDKIEALDAGADDYITKPFSMPEVLARVRANLRRVPLSPHKGPVVVAFDGIEVNLGSRHISIGGRDVRLTPKQFEVLHYLVANPDRKSVV